MTRGNSNGVSMRSEGNFLVGTWYLNSSSTAVTSDYNKKNTINPLSYKYDQFFNLLIPVTYKYNEGTSDRLHTGFIAQDVEKALFQSNISTTDFAGFVKQIGEDKKENYYLRYEEFVSLNTWQIQKLKARVSELENKILELEAKL